MEATLEIGTEVTKMNRTLLVFLVVCVGLSTASTFSELVTECPHHPGMCQDSVTGEFHAAGSQWGRPGQCVQLTCHFPTISGLGCPPPGQGPPECHVTEGNLEAAYPDCCPRLECP
ncbi:uncharacterized protein [Anabrus simplex]|uniref:uncharacterized protein n=1 Tax=Anabrus simplex TaxID=316456 RepID=UPI0035A2E850